MKFAEYLIEESNKNILKLIKNDSIIKSHIGVVNKIRINGNITDKNYIVDNKIILKEISIKVSGDNTELSSYGSDYDNRTVFALLPKKVGITDYTNLDNFYDIIIAINPETIKKVQRNIDGDNISSKGIKSIDFSKVVEQMTGNITIKKVEGALFFDNKQQSYKKEFKNKLSDMNLVIDTETKSVLEFSGNVSRVDGIESLISKLNNGSYYI